jgi:hypothetical protein
MCTTVLWEKEEKKGLQLLIEWCAYVGIAVA